MNYEKIVYLNNNLELAMQHMRQLEFARDLKQQVKHYASNFLKPNSPEFQVAQELLNKLEIKIEFHDVVFKD